MTLFLLVAGMAFLVVGAEALVKGASGLAATAGVSSLVIGLTVVAFGTSSPELSVSVVSALQGKPDLALGNVVGSNILNVLLILGLCAAITPLAVQRQLIRLDTPAMVGASVVGWLLALDSRITRGEAGMLVAGLVVYTAHRVLGSRRESANLEAAGAHAGPRVERHAWYVDAGLVVVGLVALVLGSRWFLAGAVTLARSLGMSELLIGLTLVALGTSLPEVATSVMATIRGERDIAVGNVVGSNIFNLLGVLGVSGAVASGGLPVSPAALTRDLPVMTAIALACVPVFVSGLRIARWEGWLFLAYYVAYTGYLALAETGSALAPGVGKVLVQVFIPVTVGSFIAILARSMREWSEPGAEI
ncbi:MAG: calcium/sodium antiporter [Gemmatimonadetes bacterium]|nr:calcium/sodium antiporter [Gemmatimonadota bacterium]